MKNAVKYLVCGTVVAWAVAPATAADIYEPPVQPPYVEIPEYVPEPVTGWYLRGDVGYSWNKLGDVEYITYGPPPGTNLLSGDLKDSFTVGGGIGYKMNHYLRTDLTFDYDFESDFEGSTTGGPCLGGAVTTCVSTDLATWSAMTLMANAYVDVGTVYGVTGYVGAGLGGAYVKWGDLSNTVCDAADSTSCDATVVHDGSSEWRFAYALMAGASYDFNCKLTADVGYRYRKIQGGRMFEYAAAGAAGPAFDDGMASHQVRAGLRYKLGACAQPQQIVYQPEPLPPVYK